MDDHRKNIEDVAVPRMSHSTMSQNVTLRKVEEVPGDSRVCHYDELDEETKERFPTLAANDNDAPSVDPEAVEGLECCDLVKYTDYYEVTLHSN